MSVGNGTERALTILWEGDVYSENSVAGSISSIRNNFKMNPLKILK